MIDLDMTTVDTALLIEWETTAGENLSRAVYRAVLVGRGVAATWTETVIMPVTEQTEILANGTTHTIEVGDEVVFTPTNVIVTRPTVGTSDMIKARDDQFTLGAFYIPDSLDAHGEWTDPDTLQKAAWEYTRNASRDIFLQHDRTVKAGEWVEIMSWPEPISVTKDDGVVKEYPAGTVFIGVVWDDWAWPLVKSGDLSGMSIGGTALRSPEMLDSV